MLRALVVMIVGIAYMLIDMIWNSTLKRHREFIELKQEVEYHQNMLRDSLRSLREMKSTNKDDGSYYH